MGNNPVKEYPQKKVSYISPVTHGDSFDPVKFAGSGANDHWYEIGHSTNDFERDVKHVAHTIVLLPRSENDPGGPIVVTSTYDSNRNLKYEQQGRLYTPNPNDKSKMELKYKSWFGSRPIDFWVYDTDYDNYAVIGNTKGMIWILGRKPTMSICNLSGILSLMRSKGFDTSPESLRVDVNYITPCSPGEKWDGGQQQVITPVVPSVIPRFGTFST